MTSEPSPLARRVYRTLLHLYPRDIRQDISDDAVETFAELHRDTKGPLRRLALWRSTIAAVVSDARRERRAFRHTDGREQPIGSRAWAAATRFGSDARLGLRIWNRHRVQALVAIGSLAIGVGINIAVMNVMLTLFVQPALGSEPDRLVSVSVVRDTGVSYGVDADTATLLVDQAQVLDGLATDRFGWAWVVGAGEPVEIQASAVSFNYFDVLGLRPAAGRLFGAIDAERGRAGHIGVVSHAFWQARLGGDPGIVGRLIEVDGRPLEVVGVGPAGFRGPFSGLAHDLWIPGPPGSLLGDGRSTALFGSRGSYELVGRLAPGRSIDQAASALSTVLARVADPEDGPTRVAVHPVRGVHPGMRDSFLGTPLVALAIAGILLALTCLNLAGLLGANNLARGREFALRLALGATRRRLLLQLCSETAGVAVLAAALALVTAAWAQDLVARWFAYGLPGLTIAYDWRAVAIGLVMTAATAIAFSGLPAWFAIARAGRTALDRGTGPIGASSDAPGRQALLLAGQLALSLMLVAAAAVMTRSLTLAFASGGTDTASVLHYRLRPSRVGYDAVAGARYQRQVLDEVGRIPGVRSAALATVGPTRGWCCPVDVEDPNQPDVRIEGVENNAVTTHFFDTLDVPVVAGRGFDERDTLSSPRVAIVNDALANRLWPGQTAIGRQFTVDGRPHTVVGRTETIHPSRPGEAPVPYFYQAYSQAEAVDGRLYIRVASGAEGVSRAVHAALTAAGPDVHVGQAGTLAERLSLAFAPQLALSRLLETTAVLAVVLSVLGLFGQLSLVVARRRRELAVRCALGATPGALVRDVAGRGLRIVAAGIVLGLAGVWAQGRVLESYVAGVSPVQPSLVALAVAALLVVGMTTAIVPARRAGRVDPVDALRSG